MPKHLDHIVILVADLARASADYAALGLTVTPGGEHTSGATHNALISFADGTYFELIAFKESGEAPGHRWDARRAQGEGLIDFALLSEDLTAEPVVTQAGAVSPRGPIEMGRLRPDGARVDWRIIALSATQSALPFVIEDVTPRRLRVPDGAAMRHRLPATRVAGLTVVVKDLAAATTAYIALLGEQGEATHAAIEGAGAGQRFRVGEQWIALVTPADAASALGQHLTARGEGPYEVVLSGDNATQPGSGELLPLAGTHGARIRIAQ